MGYIRFDVDKIKDFVFESLKPMEVMGASEMIKLLDEDGELLKKEYKKKFPNLNMDVIYARGGGGLLRVNQQEKDFCRWLQRTYQETVKGGKLTAVSCRDLDKFPAAYSLLNYKLREEKNQKVLYSPAPKPITFAKEDSLRRCNGCGKRKAKEKIDFSPDEKLYYCDVCLGKRVKGKDIGNKNEEVKNLEDLLKSIPGVKDSTYLLMIYGDLNEAGDLFASMETEDKLRDLSKLIYKTLNELRKELENKLLKKGFRSLMPVAGGDDLIIFIHPAAFGLIKDILYGLEERLSNAVEKITDKKLKMNFSFLTAKHNFPIYNLFNISEELLKLTKKEYYKENSPGSGKTHYGFYWLEEGSSRPNEKDVYQKEEFMALFDFAQKVHRNEKISASSIHQLLDLLPVIDGDEDEEEIKTRSQMEEQFNIAYFLARNPELDKMLVPQEEGYTIEGEENLKVSRNLWEDVIDMRELFIFEKEKEVE